MTPPPITLRETSTEMLADGAKLKANSPQPIPIAGDRISVRVTRAVIEAPTCGSGSAPRFGLSVSTASPHPVGPCGATP
jgi:hypothetical protein